jgi:lipopolysaccharide export LptBFGC system permease protein LptF
MILTLHRYIFKELLKIFALSTLAMSLIVSLGFLLKPIQNYGISPGQIFHLLGYLLPITLTFVLPMGALFAASMVYGRFAADRELDACRASGIGLWTLIYPALCLAILVAMANLILSFHVAPAFVHRSERSVKANAEQILFRNLQRKGFYTLPKSNYKIYAEKADPQRKLLEGVIIIDTKKDNIQRMITAGSARVDIQAYADYNQATITALDTYRVDDLSPVYMEELVVSSQFESLLSDSIRFQKLARLKSIRADKMKFFPVRQLAQQAYAQLTIEEMGEYFNGAIRASDKPIQLDDAEGIRTYLLRAGGCRVVEAKDYTLEFLPPIQLTEMDKIRNEVICKYESQQGVCRLENNAIGAKLELDMDRPAWDRGGSLHGVALREFVSNLLVPEPVRNKLADKPVLQTLERIGQDPALLSQPSTKLINCRKSLMNKLASVNNEIDAELHSRLVLGLGCVSLILTGAALGIYLRGGHLLSAFGASAIPAGVLIVFIMAGKQITQNPSTSAAMGVTVMWTGFVILAVLTLVLYRRLLKT